MNLVFKHKSTYFITLKLTTSYIFFVVAYNINKLLVLIMVQHSFKYSIKYHHKNTDIYKPNESFIEDDINK